MKLAYAWLMPVGMERSDVVATRDGLEATVRALREMGDKSPSVEFIAGAAAALTAQLDRHQTSEQR